MIKLFKNGAFLLEDGSLVPEEERPELDKNICAKNTMAYGIMQDHNQASEDDGKNLKLKFDTLASHDITYVGIIQTARASGLTEFPLPYVLTNCHNSLCAVGGTINEDDHLFGLSAAKKYGGIYVPAHQAVIHQYMREQMVGCGKMILGSDSHTRYGALGTMAVGEGGGELAKQLLKRTYDVKLPDVVAVYLTGEVAPYVGPQDVALAIIGKVFANGYVKNKVMEFIGGGIKNLGVEYRNGIDVMTTETTCLSSVWITDEKVEDYYNAHGRGAEYRRLYPKSNAYYSGAIVVDLSEIKPMIALPFHPSNVYEIDELNANLEDILHDTEEKANKQLDKVKINLREKIVNGKLLVDQGVIAGCAGGTFDNICDASDILNGYSVGDGAFSLSVYPSSQPTFLSLVENGAIAKLMAAGASIRSAFCGPCFGAGDVPSNNGFSIRHSTRNFPNREGSKPSNGQIASVALMDARSIAATARNKGLLTSAEHIDFDLTKPRYYFKKEVYDSRVYMGCGKANQTEELKFGPNIVDWPKMNALGEHLLLQAASIITDPVTTTDELIPSGETSSYRSNPLALAEFTLSRKDPDYVGRAKSLRDTVTAIGEGKQTLGNEHPLLTKAIENVNYYLKTKDLPSFDMKETSVGSFIYAIKPGDGSAREQAASCQKVLGGLANIAAEYATKRYRSNLINWGMLPFVLEGEFNKEKPTLGLGDFIFIPNIAKAIKEKQKTITAYIVDKNFLPLTLSLGELTDDERDIILSGCLINYYKS